MRPTRRQLILAGFLTVFALGFWFLSLVPGAPLVPAVLGLAWLIAAIFGGWKLFPDPPAVRTPDLTVPEIFLTPEPEPEVAVSSEEVVEPEVGVADEVSAPVEVEAEAQPEMETQLETEAEPVALAPREPESSPQSIDWTPLVELLDLLEAELNRADPLVSGFQEAAGNAAFIKANVQQSYEIADNLAGGAQRAFALSEKVQKGVVVVTDALMESLKQTEVLSEHSQRITGILQLMGEVSDKIHVLSINASIVSARAGAAGRGFEVVAKEIRSLAKETEHSLGDIVEVIELLRSSIAKVIQVVQDADLETQQEKSSLIEVAGALQGVILGVEIVKAVSGMAKEKAEEQDKLVQTLSSTDRGVSPELKSKVAAVKARLEEWNSKE